MRSYSNISKKLFKTIYQLAKDKNEETLTSLVNKGLCVGSFNGAFNNIMLLAKEGDWESAEFLIKKFDANMAHLLFGAAWGGHVKTLRRYAAEGNENINYIVKGAACGGNILLTDELLGRGASLHHAAEGAALGGHINMVLNLIGCGANIDFAVRGAACAGNIELTQILLQKYASLAYASEGAACGEHIALLNEIIEQAGEIGEAEKIEILSNAALGASYSGNFSLTIQLLEEANGLAQSPFSESGRYSTGYLEATYGAASGGHTTLLNTLLKLVFPKNKTHSLSYASMGAGAQGHSQLLYTLIANNNQISRVLIQFAAIGSASGGNLKLVYDLLQKGAPLTSIARGAMNGHQLALLNNICKMGNIDLGETIAQSVSSGYLNTQDRLRFMSFIDDTKLRSALAEKLHSFMPVASATLLLNQATKLNLLMRQYELSFYQAQGYLKLVADKSFSWMLLQGHRYISNNQLPFEIYLRLIELMIGPMEKPLRNGDMEHIYRAAHKRLRDRIIQSSTTGFFALFKKEAEINRIKEEAKQRYQERLRY